MNIQQFGDQLIRTGDLDPLYIGLSRLHLPHQQLARYLLSYWCFYHVGLSAWLSEWDDGDYWQYMMIAAINKVPPRMVSRLEGHVQPDLDRWPRSTERRHFRGDKCVAAMEHIRDLGSSPEDLIHDLHNGAWRPLSEREVMARVQRWPMFGPWIAFKVADMLERVWGAPVVFDPNIVLMYDEPRRALDLLPQHHPHWVGREPAAIYAQLLTYFSPRPAPPAVPGGRGCGPQEVETVLCKWKSMIGGHYYVGKDIWDHREALQGWGRTADALLRAYPEPVAGSGGGQA